MTDFVYTRSAQPAGPTLWTYRDLIDRLMVFANAGSQSVQYQDYRIAIDEACRWVIFKKNFWRYFLKVFEVPLVAPYSTGTVAYTQSNRTLTLTDGTWPSWAAYGNVRIANVFYQVQSRTDDTNLVLPENSNPGSDVASGTSYAIYRSVFTLPADFRKMYHPENNVNYWFSNYIEPSRWFALERHIGTSNRPYHWTVMRDPKLVGSWALYLYPHPSSAMTVGMLYEGSLRPLRVSGYATNDSVGTVAVSSTTVTGTATSFSAADVGSLIRFSSSTTLVPDGTFGVNPYTEQAVITAVASTTSCTIDRALSGTYSGVKYVKSDPVDLPESMIEAVMARARYTYSKNKPDDAKNWREYERISNEALIVAEENDCIMLPSPQGFYFDRMQQDV